METEGALIHFGVRGASRTPFRREKGALVLAFHSALRFAVVSDTQERRQPLRGAGFQSALRFAVVSDRYRFRSCLALASVSIRFKVRGGFRREVTGMPELDGDEFQSALRFAVVSDEPLAALPEWIIQVSIRFKVRGGFRPYPLARRPDKPCCGGFTHHPSSPPPTSGQNLS